MKIDNFFQDQGIDLPAVLSDLCSKMPNAVFCNNRTEIYKLVVPASTEDLSYAAFVFPADVYPRQLLNFFESKTDDFRILYGDPITLSLVTNEVELKAVDYKNVAFCRHGGLYIVERDAIQTTYYMKAVTVRRIADSLMDDVLEPIKNLYYGLYSRNTEIGYGSMNLISNAISNHVASNQRVLPLMVHDVEDEEPYLL